ncbi:hypothetical protein PSP20601_03369 [Pandoraea sputorum]|uniref:Uncharacterized protein n=1 Tax=Pandoraea sputorum TaxID=93222 RepID=A0A239SQM1_9BURK|nr:Uncharacterised protein [Pandoraea sputorum]VVE25425.1 hypothetical protein PSP20601_03369 [Pandoraea sputorum]VVE78032.1 hypothetical protein PSP31120_01412 [Pandoraea sputorum]
MSSEAHRTREGRRATPASRLTWLTRVTLAYQSLCWLFQVSTSFSASALALP